MLSRKLPYQFKVYVPPEKELVVKKFLEICEREGKSGSDKVRELMEEYVRLHEPGNPQRRLDTILGSDGKPAVNCRHFLKLYKAKAYCRLHGIWGPLSRCEKCPLHGR